MWVFPYVSFDAVRIKLLQFVYIFPEPNTYIVWGADSDFGDKDGRQGWVAYRDGKLVIPGERLPARITMADAFNIYKNVKDYVR